MSLQILLRVVGHAVHMAAFLAYESAMERLGTVDGAESLKLVRVAFDEQHTRDWSVLRTADLRQFGIHSQPLHVLTPSAGSRMKARGIVAHVWRQPGSKVVFERLAPGLYSSTPEACFLQMAKRLDLLDLILFGFELCGSYSTHNAEFRKRRQLTNRSSLIRYAHSVGRHDGCVQAFKALRYIRDHSASPMETALALILGLPASLGGYGLGMPLMNGEVRIGSKATAEVSYGLYHCDLFWPEAKVALEYDSDKFHLGTLEHAHDARRRNDLERMGCKVITVTWGQLASLSDLDTIARQAASVLHRRIRSKRNDVTERRIMLWKRVITLPHAKR